MPDTAGFTSPAHLPEIAGMVAATSPDFGREQWTTTTARRLRPGDVFALPGERPVRPVVLVDVVSTKDGYGQYAESLRSGEVRYIDNGEAVTFRMPAGTSVLTRCDLMYRTPPPAVPWVTAEWEQIGDDESTRVRLSHPIRVF